MKKLLMAGVAAAGLALSPLTAGAATIGDTGPGNDIIGDGIKGWYGGQWYLFAGAATTVEVFFIGREAGWDNKFTLAGTDFGPYGNTAKSSLFGGSFDPVLKGTKLISPGLIDFSFTTGNPDGSETVTNGSNPGQPFSPEFWSAVYDCDLSLPLSACISTGSTKSGGNTLLLALDDGGGGRDDNHDDLVMVIRIKDGTFVVPEPATLGLLGAGLLGLGFAARRRRTA